MARVNDTTASTAAQQSIERAAAETDSKLGHGHGDSYVQRNVTIEVTDRR